MTKSILKTGESSKYSHSHARGLDNSRFISIEDNAEMGSVSRISPFKKDMNRSSSGKMVASELGSCTNLRT